MIESKDYEFIKFLQKIKLLSNEKFLLTNEFLNELLSEKIVTDFSKKISLPKDCYSLDSCKNIDFFRNIEKLFNSKTENGNYYFENLCLSNVFNDFNKDKEIPEILIFNGRLQPIFSYEDSIFEKVYVETPLDTDEDGDRDLIEVYIRRPLETNKGMKVPVIYIANPYMLGSDDDSYKTHNVDLDLEVIPETNISYEEIRYKYEHKDIPKPRKIMGKGTGIDPGKVELDCITPWYNYFLIRGYGLVFAGGIGTKGSQGVRTSGSVDETISTISVIDWLNKRIPGFSNKTDNLEVLADWCTGNVGMTGKSYLGTLSIAAAISSVDGLKTIVPEAAISNWYDYYRCNGLTVPAMEWQGDDADLLAKYCLSRMFDPEDYKSIEPQATQVLKKLNKDQDRISGNYNKFWDERNYLNSADKIKASVFIVHGLRDWNVKPKQFDMLWKKLVEHNIPRKMILHQGDHIYIHNLMGIEFTDIMNRWYGHWLYGIENNIMNDIPNVNIQSNSDINLWESSTNWPFDGCYDKKLFVNPQNKLIDSKTKNTHVSKLVDNLSLTGYDRSLKNEETWLDSIVSNPEIVKPYRLGFLTNELTQNTRISGTVNLQLECSLNFNTGILSGMLVDYGVEKRPSLELKTASVNDLVEFSIEENFTEHRVITRGWLNVQNRKNIYNKEAIVKETNYLFNFDFQPIDYTILKKHKLGLIIYSTDAQQTVRQFRITEFKVKDDSIVLTVPMK